MSKTVYNRNLQLQGKKSGQAILFLLVVMLIGTVVVLWNFGLHRAIVTKMRLRDGGDGAALMGARWQGISLNMVGELNLAQAVMASELIANADPSEVDIYDPGELQTYLNDELQELYNLRRKISLQGPLVGFSAAQQMVLNNRIYANNEYGSGYNHIAGYIAEAAEIHGDDVGLAFADTLYSVARNAVAAKITPVYNDSYVLWDMGFYNAIDAAARGNWCQFHINGRYEWWLNNYSSPGDWPEPPDDSGWSILGLNLRRSTESLISIVEERSNITSEVTIENIASTYNELEEYLGEEYPDLNTDNLSLLSTVSLQWHQFGNSWYESWSNFASERGLPYRSSFVPHFDYMGVEANIEINLDDDWSYEETYRGTNQIVRWDSDAGRYNYFDLPEEPDPNLPDKTERKMRWTAAAKALGALDLDDDASYTPAYFGLVLPCFDAVRLIPVQRHISDLPTSPGLDFDHFHVHLTDYLREESSDELRSGCWYCQQLIRFEDASFRTDGQEWLDDEDNTEHCISVPLTGGSGGGGAPSGH